MPFFYYEDLADGEKKKTCQLNFSELKIALPLQEGKKTDAVRFGPV